MIGEGDREMREILKVRSEAVDLMSGLDSVDIGSKTELNQLSNQTARFFKLASITFSKYSPESVHYNIISEILGVVDSAISRKIPSKKGKKVKAKLKVLSAAEINKQLRHAEQGSKESGKDGTKLLRQGETKRIERPSGADDMYDSFSNSYHSLERWNRYLTDRFSHEIGVPQERFVGKAQEFAEEVHKVYDALQSYLTRWMLREPLVNIYVRKLNEEFASEIESAIKMYSGSLRGTSGPSIGRAIESVKHIREEAEYVAKTNEMPTGAKHFVD